MKRTSTFLWAILLCLGILGCGYTTRSTLRGDLQTIYIENFKNEIDFTADEGRSIYFPLLEVKVKNAVVSRFQFDGNLKIAKENNADLVLRGTLKDYNREVLRYTDSDNVQEYRVRVTVSLELYDNVAQKVFWIEDSFSGEAEYFVTGALATSEEFAVEAATLDLARRIVERTIENW